MKRTAHNPKYSTRITNVTTDAVIINRDQWRRTKKSAVHLTPEQQKELKRRQEEERSQTMSAIQTKRATMITPEVSNDILLNTHSTLGKREERDYALKIADSKANEDLDEIKTINSLIVAARARTERDNQLAEHEQIHTRELQEKKEWDDKLEESRRKQCQLYDERERLLQEQRRRGRAIINAQIEEHKINAILEAERRDRESKALAAQNALIAEEDRRILIERKQRQQAFLHDCLDATAAMKRRREMEKQRVNEEAEMIIEYNAQKALKEEALEKEKAAQKALKEREIAEIRMKQERAIDTQAIRDEEMAKRVQEEKERLADEKEARDCERKIEAEIELIKGRKQMQAAKRERLLKEAQLEAAEYARVKAANEAARAKAKEQYLRKLEQDGEYRAELFEEMEDEYQRRRVDPAKKVAEARKNKEANDEYLSKLEELRQQKIKKMEAEGIPMKYQMEVRNLQWDIK